jgi:hypothetical protein
LALEAARRPANPADAGKIATALGLFASAIKSGESWSTECDRAQKEAHEALVRLSAR